MGVQSNRDVSLDILKGFAIFCVVIGHCLQYLSNPGLSSWLAKGIYFFHMPLFMFISGYFYYKSLKHHTIQDVIVSKVKTLLLPSFINTIFLWLVTLSILSVSFGRYYLDSFWFLKTLFIFTIVSLLVGKNIVLGSIVGFASVVVLKDVMVNHNLYLFFLGGIVFSKIEFLIKGKEFTAIAGCSILTLVLAMFNAFSIRIPLWEGGVDSMMRLFVVLLILLFVRLISNKQSWIFTLFCDWGKYTKEIYITQVYLVEELLGTVYPYKAHTSVFLAVLFAFIIMPILVFIVKYLGRIKYVNPFLFGKFER